MEGAHAKPISCTGSRETLDMLVVDLSVTMVHQNHDVIEGLLHPHAIQTTTNKGILHCNAHTEQTHHSQARQQTECQAEPEAQIVVVA